MFGSDKKKVPVKPTQFVVTIAGQEYRFGALSQREMEKFVSEELAVKTDPAKLKAVWQQVVATAFSKGGNDTTVEDLAELDVPLFNALFQAIMNAHHMKLESKLGEAKPL
jgi:hypothetical protein